MPFVILKRNPKVISDDVVKAILKDLPTYVAEALYCHGGGELTAGEVEIEVHEPGKLDVNYVDFEVTIVASDYPARQANLKERTQAIANLLAIHPAMPKGSVSRERAFVWVVLPPAAFVWV